jgi:hypothetical protein
MGFDLLYNSIGVNRISPAIDGDLMGFYIRFHGIQ